MTLAAGLFVAGGLLSLALDDQPVAFALPEPPPAPVKVAPAPADPPDGNELARAFAHIRAEFNTPR